jgi:hypothetical protein
MHEVDIIELHDLCHDDGRVSKEFSKTTVDILMQGEDCHSTLIQDFEFMNMLYILNETLCV